MTVDLLTETTGFTATPLPEFGAIRLEWAGVVVDQLWRTDANGTRAVRTLEGLLPAASAVTDDYEAALVGDVTYVAVSVIDGASQEATTSMGGTATWLSVPIAPAHSMTLELVTGLGSGRSPMGTVHQVIGREDPLAVLGGLRKRAGSIDMHCSTYAAAKAVEALYGAGAVMLLRQPDWAGLDLWHVPEGDVTVTPDPGTGTWDVTVGYREVSPQAGPLTGTLGRDYSDVLAEASSYLALRLEYATYADLQTGD